MRPLRWASFSSLAALVVATCGCAGGVGYDYARELDPRQGEYVIGVADGLKITVWRNADLSVEVRVRPDGTITLPLLGDLPAAGRTPTLLKAQVVKLLVGFVKDEGAVVTVAVTESNSYRFTVAGAVERPGIFTARSYLTVTDAIALAGGPNRFASARMTLVRTDARGVRRIPLDYGRIGAGRHPEENLVLITGDALFVD